MSSKRWEWIRIEDSAIEIIDGDRGKNYPKQDEFSDNGYCLFLNAGNVTDSGFDFQQLQFISKEKDLQLRKGKLTRNDIVLTTRGTVGNVSYYDKSIPYENMRINSGMVIFRMPKPQSEFDAQYFYHFLRSNLFKDQVLSHSSGSAQPQLPIKDLRQISVACPPLPTQRRIADILSALDDKIELNRQTNATLEAMAQAIFKEWFVDFNYPGATGELVDSELGMIPAGWRVGKVGDVCLVNSNSITKADNFDWIDYIEISQVNRGEIANITRYLFGEEPSRARRKLKHGDTVLSTVRPNRGAYFLAIDPPETSIASTGFAVFSPTKVPYGFLYLLLTDSEKLEYYGQVADGGAYPAINPNLIMDMDLVVPEDSILNQFHTITNSIFNKMSFAAQESQSLTQIRDILLPKFMSGEIEV